jgi:hypothetical protein
MNAKHCKNLGEQMSQAAMDAGRAFGTPQYPALHGQFQEAKAAYEQACKTAGRRAYATYKED